MRDENQRTKGRLQISQETIAIVTVGVALAGLILVATGDLRDEARADRAAWQAESRQLRDEARADRAAWQAESQKLGDEARAEREAFRREGEAFRREILRLTQEQAELAAIVASTRPTNE